MVLPLALIVLVGAAPLSAAEPFCDRKNEIVTRLVAEALSDSVSMGEWDRAQNSISQAKAIDSDVLDAYVIRTDLGIVASTDPKRLDKTRRQEGRDAAAKVRAYARHALADGSVAAETPILNLGQPIGVLHVLFAKTCGGAHKPGH